MLDEKILENAIKGDKKAFKYIYEKLFDSLWYFIYSRIKDKEVANDIISDSFVSLFENIKSVKYPKAVKNYLYKIAINKLNSHYKKPKDVPFDEAYIQIEVKTKSSSNSKQFNLEEILRKLPEKYQNVLRLRFLSNLSIKEVSEITGSSIDNVKVMQFRAIKQAKSIAKQIYNINIL